MIFPLGEKGIGNAEAREIFGELTGWTPSKPWMDRSFTQGCAGVRLRSARVGGKRLTCRAWIIEYIEACNVQPVGAA